MAWTYGFFNSVNGDRKYNADQMSHIFEGLITDGVYESVANKMAVQPNNGMVIQIATGRGWFNKHWVNNDSEYLLTLAESDVVLNRYVAVCIRVDESDSVRTAVPYLKYSDFATNPVKPTMTRSETINEYCLAYVYIPAKATAITASNIEDTRFDTTVCGWVTGLIDQVDTSTLYTQWAEIFDGFMTENVETFESWFDARQTEYNNWLTNRQTDFNSWFNNLQVELDSETATRLTNALPTSLTVNLPVSGWNERENLLDPQLKGITIRNGITCVENNGIYTLNGTATDDAYFIVNDRMYFESGKTYRITGCPAGGSTTTYYLYVYRAPTLIGVSLYDTGEGMTSTPTQSNYASVYFKIPQGTTVHDFVFKPMISTETSTTYDDYVPYGSTVNQSVNVINMNITKSVIVQANDYSKEAFGEAGVKCVAQGTNKLTFTCDSKPNSDIYVDVLHMGV